MYYALLAILIFLCCLGAGFSGKGKIFDDYMSHERTTSIKGVFALIIVMSHMLQYIRLTGAMDLFARRIIILIGQLMVTVFFFYSGYGIVESCRKKADYMKGFFRNRFLKTLVHFDMALLVFALTNVFIGKSYGLKTFLLSLFGWSAIGNSNWFVFCTLALYLLTIPAFMLLKNRRPLAIGAMWILTLGLVFFLREVKVDSWWYNTLLCYPLGMVWSELRAPTEKWIGKNIGNWWILLAGILATVAPCAILYIRRTNGHHYPGILRSMDPQFFYLFYACVFCLFVVVTQMRLRTHNVILHWLGVHSFSIYILQRIPMRILQHLGLTDPVVFIPVVLCVTMLIAPAFTWLTGQADRLLFPKKAAAAKSKGKSSKKTVKEVK